MIWKILGIEPTKDKKAITQAYREQLMHTNPEEKPEEFKQLRNAYEEALKYADNQGLRTEKTAVELWRDRLDDLYKDFHKRNSVECWKQLLSDDVCVAIDTRIAAEETMLEYFMNNYFITHDVWVFLNERFSWVERREELYEKYPKDFIDFVIINGVTYNDTLPMKMFEPGDDGECCHKYLDLYLKIRRDASENALSMVEEMLALPEKHPYGEALALSYRIHFQDVKYLDDLKELVKKYPDDVHLGMMAINEMFQAGQYEECLQRCKQLLVNNPDHHQLKWLYANSLARVGEYEEGIKQLNELMRGAGGNSQEIYDLDQKRQEWNKYVIEQKKQHIIENPDDEEAKTDLCWAYLENNMMDEANRLAYTINGDKVDPFNYHNLMSNMDFTGEHLEDGMKHLDRLIEVIKNLPEDGDEETQKRKKRLGEMYRRKGYYYYTAYKQLDKAMEQYEIALETAEDKADILTQLCQISLMEKNHAKAVKYADELIKERPESYHGYMFKAYGHFYQSQDRDAYDAVNKSLDLNRTDLGCYILKERILIRNNAFEEAESIVKFLLDNKLDEDPSVLYVQGLLKERKDRNSEEAYQFYEKSEKAMGENSASFSFSDEMFYRMAYIRGDKLNGNIEEDRNILLELIEKGLKSNPDHEGLLDYKAWLLVKAGKYDEALTIYQKLAENPEHGPSVDAQIGYIYYQDLRHKAAQSREYYLKSLANDGNYEGYFYTGMCSIYLGELDEAEKYFLELQKHEPDTLDSYFRLSTVYRMKNDLEKALENINKTIEIADRSKNDNTRYYYRKTIILRRMGRYDETIKVVEDMRLRFNYEYASKVINDILLQAGRYEEVKKHLAVWKKERPLNRDWYQKQVVLDILENNMFKAKFDKANYTGVMDPIRGMELEYQLAFSNGDFKKAVKTLERWQLAEEKNEDGDVTKVLIALAYTWFQLRDREKQLYYAEKALKQLEAVLSENRLNRLLFATRKCKALALAGRGEEALSLINELRGHSLCDSCPYGHCKDLYLFEMEITEILGNNGQAYLMALSGKDKWPDEEDFVLMANRLKKKVK